MRISIQDTGLFLGVTLIYTKGLYIYIYILHYYIHKLSVAASFKLLLHFVQVQATLGVLG